MEEPLFIKTHTGEMVADTLDSTGGVFIRIDDNQFGSFAGLYLTQKQAIDLTNYLLKITGK